MEKQPIALPPEALHAHVDAFVLMSTKALLQELTAVAQAMPEAGTSNEMAVLQGGWFEASAAMEELPAQMPATPDAIAAALRETLHDLSQWSTGLLRARLHQAQRRIVGLPRDVPWGSPSGFAVSPHWGRRLALVVSGQLYPAWVAYAELSRDPAA